MLRDRKDGRRFAPPAVGSERRLKSGMPRRARPSVIATLAGAPVISNPTSDFLAEDSPELRTPHDAFINFGKFVRLIAGQKLSGGVGHRRRGIREGLSIAHVLVETRGGTPTIGSTCGRATRIRLVLPNARHLQSKASWRARSRSASGHCPAVDGRIGFQHLAFHGGLGTRHAVQRPTGRRHRRSV
jgi:hypothetical protein